ncbi:hypothetical protein ADK57_29935 [Streptomyces sp. MMG1533]|uniref:hypothetical protein n=1 Tax=Streptomyces sp. MMG1533 TaxID=1415546 RepID=UPI0006AE7E32|nr:hypothetical protein [Streptomyces sp. MMG1533]KOU60614.1 hypothetical protein ADK57_29935 [Streptomyces sp. MMG1533]
MLRATRSGWTHGRRGALLGASAAVVCLGGMAAACGGDGDGGHVATGAAGGPPQVSGTAVAPTGEVTLVPLDETPSGRNSPVARTPSESVGATPQPRPGSGGPPAPAPSAEDAESGRTTASPASPAVPPTPGGGPSAPGGAAALRVGEPVREATDKRWCEDVTLAFHNTGGTAVRSGTVTFGTHVIGALGVDWATVESAEKLPAPIGAGARTEKSWTVCVDVWRVPWGMHVETQDVSVQWK